jgi:Mg2+-importing ATPase
VVPLLPFLPLLPKQILLNNFLSDLPSMAISTDNVDAEDVLHPRRWHVRDVQRFMIIFGLVSSCFDFVTFAILLFVFRIGEAGFQTAWFVVSLLTEIAVVMVLRTRRPAWHSHPSRLLLQGTVAVLAAGLAFPYLPIAPLLGFVPLKTVEVVTLLAIVGAYVAVTELAKTWFYRVVATPLTHH